MYIHAIKKTISPLLFVIVYVSFSVLSTDLHADMDFDVAMSGVQSDPVSDNNGTKEEYSISAGTEIQPADVAHPNKKQQWNVGIVLYPGFEVLDVYGPLEIWGYAPNFNIILIAEKEGPIASAQGAATIATHSFETAPSLDILMVPGGIGSRAEINNPKLLSFITSANKNTRYTTSVCTGAALLAKTGILDGHRATSNKRFFFFAQQQSQRVNWIEDARWVESGKMFTSSGVSAGTDMALGLVAKIYGLKQARELASAVEYVWHEDASNDPFAKYTNRLTVAESEERLLLKSQPQPNARLTASPTFLRLFFSQLPQVSTSSIKLYPLKQPDKPIVLTGLHYMGANDLMIAVSESLNDGQYVVEWRAGFASDPEALSGSFKFTLDTTTE